MATTALLRIVLFLAAVALCPLVSPRAPEVQGRPPRSESGFPPLTRACQAPPLPKPAGKVVTVATESQLQKAVSQLTSNTTILLKPGTYRLTSTLWLGGGKSHVAVRGATDRCEDVVLAGRGMTNPGYGNVPHGIHIGNARNVLIANLTIRDVYYHPIQLDPNLGAQAPHFYNLRLQNAGEQFIKSSAHRHPGGPGVDYGVVEYCIMEYDSAARSSYTNGVDVLSGRGWVIRNNVFRNIRAPAGQLAGPCVLVWNRSGDTITEGNLFLNCQYGIAYGLQMRDPNDHQGGIIRNNFFHRSSGQSGDVGIYVCDSPGTLVLHNTVILSGTYPNAIEYRFRDTTGVEIRYNLCDGLIQVRDGASGTVSDNVTNALQSWFVDAAAGDLHLVSSALAAIDGAAAHPSVTSDYDGDPRPSGAAPDVGADEYRGGTPPPPMPEDPLTPTETRRKTSASSCSTGGRGTFRCPIRSSAGRTPCLGPSGPA